MALFTIESVAAALIVNSNNKSQVTPHGTTLCSYEKRCQHNCNNLTSVSWRHFVFPFMFRCHLPFPLLTVGRNLFAAVVTLCCCCWHRFTLHSPFHCHIDHTPALSQPSTPTQLQWPAAIAVAPKNRFNVPCPVPCFHGFGCCSCTNWTLSPSLFFF